MGVVALMWEIQCSGTLLFFEIFFLFVGYFKENILAAVLGVAAADTTKIAHLANKTLEVVTLDIFTNNGWPSNNRLGL